MIADQKVALYSTNIPFVEVENSTNALNALRYLDTTVMWTDKYHCRAYPSFFHSCLSNWYLLKKYQELGENVVVFHKMLRARKGLRTV